MTLAVPPFCSDMFRQTHVVFYGCNGHHWHGVIIRAHSQDAIL